MNFKKKICKNFRDRKLSNLFWFYKFFCFYIFHSLFMYAKRRRLGTSHEDASEEKTPSSRLIQHLGTRHEQIMSWYQSLSGIFIDHSGHNIPIDHILSDTPKQVTLDYIRKTYTFFKMDSRRQCPIVCVQSQPFVFAPICTFGRPWFTKETRFLDASDAYSTQPPNECFYEFIHPFGTRQLAELLTSKESAERYVRELHTHISDVTVASIMHMSAIIDKIVGSSHREQLVGDRLTQTVNHLLTRMGIRPEEKSTDLENYFETMVQEDDPVVWVKSPLCVDISNVDMDDRRRIECTRRHIVLEEETVALMSSGTLDEEHIQWAASFLSTLHSISGVSPANRQEITLGTAKIPGLRGAYRGLPIIHVYLDNGVQKGRLVPAYESHYNHQLFNCEVYPIVKHTISFCGDFESGRPATKFTVVALLVGSKRGMTKEINLEDFSPFPGELLSSNTTT